MSRTIRKRITTPLITKGTYAHKRKRVEDEDCDEQIQEGVDMYDATKNTDDLFADYEAHREAEVDKEWDEYWRALDADLEYQQAWQQMIDDDEAGNSTPPWEE